MDSISRLDTTTGEWTTILGRRRRSLGPAASGGCISIVPAGCGRVRSAGGLSRWDGTIWTGFRTSNSGIPNETVQTVFESRPRRHVGWHGAALHGRGHPVGLRRREVAALHERQLGYSGAEPLTIAEDAEGKLWIGTQTAGIDILRLER